MTDSIDSYSDCDTTHVELINMVILYAACSTHAAVSVKNMVLCVCVHKEIDVQNKKAIVIFVPVPQLRAYQKIQTRLVRELEKKFSGKHVVFIAQVYTLHGARQLYLLSSFLVTT